MNLTWTDKNGHDHTAPMAQAQRAAYAAGCQHTLRTMPPSAVAPDTDKDKDTRRRAAAGRKDWTMDVDARDREAAQADADALRAMGLAPGRTLFAPGMPLVRWGLDKWTAMRTQLDAAPRVRESAPAIVSAVAAEGRVDRTVPNGDLRLAVHDGVLRLVRESLRGTDRAHGLALERNGLRALASRFPGMLPRAAFVHTMLAEEIADLWNQRAARGVLPSGRSKVRARRAVDSELGWSMYALTGPRYADHDVDMVAADLAAVSPDARGVLAYDADNVALAWEIASMRDVPPVVGEVYRMVHGGGTRDDGNGSVFDWGGFLRVLCCNLTTEELRTVDNRRAHRGRNMATQVRRQLQATVRSLAGSFKGFSHAWTVCAETGADRVLDGATVRENIAALVDGDARLRAAASGIKRDALVEMLLRGAGAEVDVDGPGSIADVVNAVTRIHTERVPVQVRQAVEAHAGTLVRGWAEAVA